MEKYRLIKELVEVYLTVDKMANVMPYGKNIMMLRTMVLNDIDKAVEEAIELDKEKK